MRLCELVFAHNSVILALPTVVTARNLSKLMPGAQVQFEKRMDRPPTPRLRACPSWLSASLSRMQSLYSYLAEDLSWAQNEDAVLKLSGMLFGSTCSLWDESDCMLLKLARLNDLATAMWVNASAFLCIIGKIRSVSPDRG